MVYDNIVVGSGISALGCVIGLLESNKKVLCIDASVEKNDNYGENLDDTIMYCKQNLPLKKINLINTSNNIFDPIDILKKQMFGGMSNVWGANCLRFTKDDLKDWPIKYDKLNLYYEKCENILNVAHFDDEISKKFEIKKINQSKLNLFSNFIKKFLDVQSKNENFDIGYARVAIDSNCYKCSKCFFGCKDDYIINTKNIFKALISEKKIDYKNQLILEKFEIKNNEIELSFANSNIKLLTKKLFIGAGALGTPKIIINSLKPKKNLDLKESQGFYIPCIYFGKDFKNETGHHTLSQGNILFNNNLKHKIGKIYYEVKYDTNLTHTSLKKQFHFFHNFIPDFLKRRIFIITGFINSEHSTYEGRILSGDLSLKIIKYKDKMNKIKNEIYSQLKLLGSIYKFFPFKLFLKMGNFGRAFHLGGSIPMMSDFEIKKLDNDRLLSKTNGELNGFKNIFIIDSTNFPNIPSGSSSLTIMANAMRIGKENIND